MNILDTKCTFKGCRIFLEAGSEAVHQFGDRMKDMIDERNEILLGFKPREPPALSVDSVMKACEIWDVPEHRCNDFRRITLGSYPKASDFFMEIMLRPHYRKALIQCLKEMKF